MKRIDIEGAVPPSVVAEVVAEDGLYSKDNVGAQKRFAHYMQPRSLRPCMQLNPEQTASAEQSAQYHAEYRIVSGVLMGTVITVTLAPQGLMMLLRCENIPLTQRLQRLQRRWQRELVQLGIPCILEVVPNVFESIS